MNVRSINVGRFIFELHVNAMFEIGDVDGSFQKTQHNLEKLFSVEL